MSIQEKGMLDGKKLSFIGSGVMAEAMINGLLRKQLTQPSCILASDIRPERCEELRQRYGVQVTDDNTYAAKNGDIVILSIKPQALAAVLGEVGPGTLQPEQLVISIVAGARISTLAKGLGHQAIVRVMPNTPAQIGAGMSVWTATSAVSEAQKRQAQAILQALGEETFVEDEVYLDMATAVSGSGPAYIFLILEALTDAAVHLGFARPIAQKLVLQTMYGSVLFAMQSPKHLAELRNMVTSPGGTTAEALYQLEKGGLRAVLSKAVWAAYQKARLLGEMSEKAGH